MNRLKRDTRGAVYTEFLIAFMPVFVMFLCLVQFAGLSTGKLLCLHAASTAVRAAVVVVPDHPKYYGVAPGSITGKRRADVENAAKLASKASTSLTGIKVNFPTSPGGSDDRQSIGRDEMMRVRVTASYTCSIPIARLFVCGGGSREVKADAAMPNQGADYEYSD